MAVAHDATTGGMHGSIPIGGAQMPTDIRRRQTGIRLAGIRQLVGPVRMLSTAVAICGEDPALVLMGHALSLVMRLTGASVGIFYTVDQRLLKFTGDVIFTGARSTLQRELEWSILRYLERYHALDPFAPRRLATSTQAVVEANDVADINAREHSPYFTEHLRTLGVGSQISLILRSEGRIVAGIDVLQGLCEPPIGSRELSLLRANQLLIEHSYDCVRRLRSPERMHVSVALATLTRRELDVAQLVAGGASNAETAQALAISESTVKTHLLHIFEKLQVRSRSRLTSLLSKHPAYPEA